MTENQYQAELIKTLKERLPGCLILKADSSYQQGIPDLFVLWRNRWASLEVKASGTASVRPNQDYWVDLLSKMSFAAYIYPENEEEVLSALQQAFEPPRRARVLKS